MSAAGRRRPDGTRLVIRATAGLAFATLVCAAVVPVALAPSPRAAEQAPGPAVEPLHMGRPTDLIRSRQWHLNAMRVPKAWKYSRGREMVVAVLDTGVDGRHPDLTGQVIPGPDYTGSSRRPGENFWGKHGTAMASIIAGHGNGPGQAAGIMGVAPQVKILSIRVTWENDDPIRRSSQVNRNRDAVAKGIRYAVDHGADIINMSLGGGRAFYKGNPTEQEAIKYALGKGVVLIASAGNDGAGANRENYPAAYPGVIAVGALDSRLRLWKDTNRHSYVSVCAPGVRIISAAPRRGYVEGDGTSPASAIVAGVAALVRARYPRLTPEEVRQALLKGVVKRPTATSKVCQGSLDAPRSLSAASKINKLAHGPSPARKTAAPTQAPAAATDGGGSNTLVLGILGGGGLLLAAGLILGWRQRRRPEEAYAAIPDLPREPVAAMAMSGDPAGRSDTKVAPINLPAWQGTDPRESPPPVPAPSTNPGAQPIWPPPPSAPPPPAEPAEPGPEVPAEPEQPVSSFTGWSQGPAAEPAPLNGNGHGNGNGHLGASALRPFDASRDDPANAAPAPDTLGFGNDPLGDDPLATGMATADTPLADESWRSVHRGRTEDALADPVEEPPTDIFPIVGRSADDTSDSLETAPNGQVTEDDLPTSAFPAVPDSLREPQREPPPRRAPDEEEFRPPWW